MPKKKGKPKEAEHGIEQAYYSRTAAGLQPSLACLCGFEAQGDTWQDAGIDLDEHLAEVEARR